MQIMCREQRLVHVEVFDSISSAVFVHYAAGRKLMGRPIFNKSALMSSVLVSVFSAQSLRPPRLRGEQVSRTLTAEAQRTQRARREFQIRAVRVDACAIKVGLGKPVCKLLCYLVPRATG